MKKVIIILISIFTLCGCNSTKKLNYKQIMQENEYVIIDVRTQEEYNEEHIVNAINIPYNVLEKEIETDKDIIVFVYCQSGNRSSKAYSTLKKLGYTVYNLGAFENIDLDKEKRRDK